MKKRLPEAAFFYVIPGLKIESGMNKETPAAKLVEAVFQFAHNIMDGHNL